MLVKLRYIFLLLLLLGKLITAQEVLLTLKEKKHKPYSPYKTVKVIDKRPGALLGYVQTGASSKVTPVVFKGVLSDSIAKLFIAKDSSLAALDLMILLEELYVMEKSQSTEGRVKITMRLFRKKNMEKLYSPFMEIDSVYTLYRFIDATKKTLGIVSEKLNDIAEYSFKEQNSIQKALKNYTYNQLLLLDSLEKLEIPAYHVEIKPGVFNSFEQFKNNTPDTGTVFLKLNKRGELLFEMEEYRNGKKRRKKKRLEPKNYYAVCTNGKIYKATNIGFYEMKFSEGNFVYSGKTSFVTSNNDKEVLLAVLGGGLLGALSASTLPGKFDDYLFTISHLNGHSIPIKRLTTD